MEPLPVSAASPESRDWWWIFDPRESLRAAAALFFGVAGVLFTLLIAALVGRTLRSSLELHLGNSFETLAAQMSDKLDRTIFERYRTLQWAASLAPLRAYATPVAERRRVLASLQEANPEFVWIGLIDAKGTVVASTGGLPEGTSVEARPWFRGAREHAYAGSLREAHEIPAELLAGESGETTRRILDLSLPVTDPDGRFAGVLAAFVRWGWAREVQVSVVPETAKRDHVGVSVYADGGELLIDSGGSGWTQPPDSPAIPERRKFRGNLIEPTSLGTTYLTGYVRSRGFREYRGLGWVTAVRQPVEYALAPAATAQRTVARWGFLFTAVCMTGAWFLAGRVSRRLRSVGAAADRIGSGDVLTVLPSGRGEGEIEQMCAALGRMVEKLRAREK